MTDATTESIDQLELQHEQTALAIRGDVNAIEIKTDADFRACEALGVTAKEGRKEFEAEMKPWVDKAHSRHKKLTGIRKRHVDEYKAIEKAVNAKCDAYTAMKQAEAEKAAREAEEKRQAELKAKEAEQLDLAETLEAAGLDDQAQKVLEQPVEEPTPAPDPVAAVPKRAGARKVWYAEITDAQALFKALGENPRHIVMSMVDLGKLATVLGLNAEAQAHHERLSIPGVEAKSKMSG